MVQGLTAIILTTRNIQSPRQPWRRHHYGAGRHQSILSGDLVGQLATAEGDELGSNAERTQTVRVSLLGATSSYLVLV